MATPRQADEYRKNQAAIVTKAHEALERAWSRLDSDPKKARQEIVDLLTTLINYFGEMSSLHAVEYYDGLRELAASGKRVPPFRAEMMTAVAMEDPGTSAGWVADAYDDGDRAKSFERAAAASQRLIQQWGRKTLMGNIKRDPARPRFARVPHGKTCGFCRLLSSRGAVYYTAETAGSLGQFHSKCDCQIVPSFNGELPYDPEPYYDEYLTAREVVGGDARKIAAKMDENLARKQAARSIDFEDTPRSPGPQKSQLRSTPTQAARSPESDANSIPAGSVNREGVKLHQHEIDTGDRLAKLGYDVTFQPRSQAGKSPDIEIAGKGSWELKSPVGASKNTITNQLRGAHKQSASVVLDLSRIELDIDQALADADAGFTRYDRIENLIVIRQDENGDVSILRNLER